MKITKRFLALSLSLALLVPIGMSQTFAIDAQQAPVDVQQDEHKQNAVYDPCPKSKRNKSNQYVDMECAKAKAVHNIKRGEGLQKKDKIGVKENYTLFVFDYPFLAKFAEELTQLMKTNSNDSLSNQILNESAGRISFFFGLDLNSSEEVAKILFEKIKANNLYDKNAIPNLLKTMQKIDRDVNSMRWWSFGGAAVSFFGTAAAVAFAPVAAGVVVGAAALGGYLGGQITRAGVASILSSKHCNNYEKNLIQVSNSVSAISQILVDIKDDYWKYKDSMSIIFNNDPVEYYATTSLNKIGINYTSEQKKIIEQRIAEARSNLKNILDKFDKK